VVVVVLGAGRRKFQELRTVQVCRAGTVGADRSGRGCKNCPAVESGLELLIRGQTGRVNECVGPASAISTAPRAWRRAGHQTAVEPPVDADPRELLRRLVLQMRR